jgi:hypothetical protein
MWICSKKWFIYNVQDQIHYLEDWNQQIQYLVSQVIFGLKEKECFMHCIFKNQLMEAGKSNTTISTLKPKHTILKNKETNHCFCLLQKAVHWPFCLLISSTGSAYQFISCWAHLIVLCFLSIGLPIHFMLSTFGNVVN